jgi:hypothetical protein
VSRPTLPLLHREWNIFRELIALANFQAIFAHGQAIRRGVIEKLPAWYMLELLRKQMIREEVERQLPARRGRKIAILKIDTDNARSTISGMLKGFGFIPIPLIKRFSGIHYRSGFFSICRRTSGC